MLLFLSMAGGAVTLAHLWRQSFRQGPLEAVVARLATATKNAVTNRPAARRPDETVPLAAVSPGADPPPRRRALIFLLVAGIALAAVYWVQIGATPLPGDAVGPVISVSDPSESDVADVTPPDAISQPVRSKPNEPASTNTDQQPEGDVERYCDLADEASAFDDAEEPEFSGDDQSATLSKMAQAAPAEIRDALNTVIDYERNRAGTGATAPDPATLQRARAILEKFDDDNC